MLRRLREQGVPTAPFYWLVGNAADPAVAEHFKSGKGHLAQKHYFDTLGDTFASITGSVVFLTSVDAELYGEVSRNFAAFSHRLTVGLDSGVSTRDTQVVRQNLASETDVPTWRKLRGAWTAWVSNENALRFYRPLMSQGAKKFAEDVGRLADQGEYFDAFQMAGNLSVRVVGTSAFGLDFDCPLTDIKGLDIPRSCPFANMSHLVKTFQLSAEPSKNPHVVLRMFFPLLAPWLRPAVPLLMDSAIARDSLASRTLLLSVSEQLLRAAKEGGGQGPAQSGSFFDIMHRSSADRKFPMTDDQTIAQVWTFIFGASETSSTALSYAIFLLARHPEAQERVREEIAEVTGGQEPSIERLSEFVYLDLVVKECLRLYPPTATNSRSCVADCVVRDGAGRELRLEKGTEVLFSLRYLHRSPKYWTDPEAFKPERFAPGPDGRPQEPSHPYAYSPFGVGPRSCIGQRFATEEVKIALIHLLRGFRLEPMPGQPDELDIRVSITATPVDGVWVRAVRDEARPRPKGRAKGSSQAGDGTEWADARSAPTTPRGA